MDNNNVIDNVIPVRCPYTRLDRHETGSIGFVSSDGCTDYEIGNIQISGSSIILIRFPYLCAMSMAPYIRTNEK